jgi:hypothetical protein
MGVDGDFPQAPNGYFLPSPLVDAVFTRNPSSSHKGPLTLTWAGPLPQQ